MDKSFVKTANAQAFLAGYATLQNRGAAESCLMVVDGEPGLGKTTILEWWAVQNGAAFLRAKQEWSPCWLLRELLSELGIAPEYSFERMYGQAVAALAARNEAAVRDGEEYAVVIDEVDHISRSARLLETLRDLSDMVEIPFILIGMGRIRKNLTRFPQIASRVGQYVEFKPITERDIADMGKAMIEVDVQPDLVAYLRTTGKGRARETMDGLRSIEQFCERNPSASIGVAEMEGQVLFYDRNSGRPIVVRAT